MEHLSTLLEKLSIIQMKYETIKQTEETFNIFSVLHKENDERRLHSRFIAALLSQQGTHGMKDLFLLKFINVVGIENLNLENAKVYPEESDKKENDNIDILIIDNKSNNAIIIENKIYAGDSNSEKEGQLERYYKYVYERKGIQKNNIIVLYLTLDGHEPSEKSRGILKGNKNFHCISYEMHILEWLSLCLKETSSYPFLRESILQYITLIKKMTNNISVEERIEIKRLIGESSTNMKSTKLLVENFKHVKWHTLREFWDELSLKLEECGYVIVDIPNDNDITNTAHFEQYKKGFEKKNNYGIKFTPIKGMQLFIKNENKYFLYWGCAKRDRCTSIDCQNKIKIFCKENINYSEDDDNLFIKNFEINNDQDKAICLTNFSLDGTFNLIDDKYRKKIIDVLVKEIKQFVNKISK